MGEMSGLTPPAGSNLEELKMGKIVFGVGLVVGMGLTAGAWADGSGNSSYNRACPDAVVAAADAQFGQGSGAITECIRVRDRLKVVAAFNSSAVNSNNGHGQQVLNARNIYNDYTNNYGMRIGEDFKVVVVGYGAGARWLLNDAAYAATYGAPNPSDTIVLDLISKGVKFYMCQNTMAGQGWTKDDLLPGVKMVPAGVTALIDFQKRGFTYINP